METAIYHNSKYLTEDQLLPASNVCCFCRQPGRSFVAILQKDPDVFLEECKHCGAASANRMPTDKVLADYYQAYYKPANVDNVTFCGINRFAGHLVEHLIKAEFNLQRKIRILDFGGGDGALSIASGKLLLAAGAAEVSVLIVDVGAKETQNKAERIQVTYRNDFPENEKFDLVIASAVLEHIPDAMPVLKKLLGCMPPNGMFYARTPYMAPFMKALRPFGKKIDFTFPGHIHDIGSFFWDNVVSVAGLGNDYRIVESRPSLVETTFSSHFTRTLAAYLCKLPWFLLGNRYGFVGGWEVLINYCPNPI